MGYYLSARNKQILEVFIEKIRSTNTDFTITLPNPKVLYDILLNSRGYEEFKWISEKFSFRIVGNDISFKYILLDSIINSPDSIQVKYDINDDLLDVFGIMDILLAGLQTQCQFTRVVLSSDEVESLKELGKLHNYTITYSNNILTVVKNG